MTVKRLNDPIKASRKSDEAFLLDSDRQVIEALEELLPPGKVAQLGDLLSRRQAARARLNATSGHGPTA